MKKEIFIILHNIRSAYNVGSIFRTADGMGAGKVYLTGYTPAPYDSELYQSRSHKMIGKTALGAEKNVPWEKIKNLKILLDRLKAQKIKIVALEQSQQSIDYRKFKPLFPLALIVGNEPKGINRKTLVHCDEIIEIPMRGEKNSLNVSVALAIAGYELTRRLK